MLFATIRSLPHSAGAVVWVSYVSYSYRIYLDGPYDDGVFVWTPLDASISLPSIRVILTLIIRFNFTLIINNRCVTTIMNPIH